MGSRTEAERLLGIERRINALEMEKARLTKRQRERARKEDTRRKIIAGAIALTHADANDAFGAELYRALGRFVRERDRHLFDLPPRRTGRPEPGDNPPDPDPP